MDLIEEDCAGDKVTASLEDTHVYILVCKDSIDYGL
jgi:hypothetical protein